MFVKEWVMKRKEGFKNMFIPVNWAYTVKQIQYEGTFGVYIIKSICL